MLRRIISAEPHRIFFSPKIPHLNTKIPATKHCCAYNFMQLGHFYEESKQSQPIHFSWLIFMYSELSQVYTCVNDTFFSP